MNNIKSQAKITVMLLNNLRLNLEDNNFSAEELINRFQQNGVKYSSKIITFLSTQGIVSRPEKGILAFTDPTKPVQSVLIEECIKQARRKQKEYIERFQNKNKIEQETIVLKTKEGFDITGTIETNYKVVSVGDKLVIVDDQHNIIKVI